MKSPVLAVYRPQDKDGFSRLVNDVHAEFGFGYDPTLDADLNDPAAHYRHILIVRDNDIVLGTAALTEPRDRTTTLKRMYLHPSLRGQGWGHRLLSGAIELAIQDGCSRIELDTNDQQPNAWRLYERSGFQLLRTSGSTRYYTKQVCVSDAR